MLAPPFTMIGTALDFYPTQVRSWCLVTMVASNAVQVGSGSDTLFRLRMSVHVLNVFHMSTITGQNVILHPRSHVTSTNIIAD